VGFTAARMKNNGYIILGGGITGLAAGCVTGLPVFEAADLPGGVCSSYYIRPGDEECLSRQPSGDEAYRFEKSGGHWIFGADLQVQKFIRRLAHFKKYSRRSAVYFRKDNLYIPFPIQYHLRFLKDSIARKALDEMGDIKKTEYGTMKKWLETTFGKTLCRYFFFPFHKAYTAGMYPYVIPEDSFKTPMNGKLVLAGMRRRVIHKNYNAEFIYPDEGLGEAIHNMAERCHINYRKRAVEIDLRRKEILFADGSKIRYKKLVSTIPLAELLRISHVRGADQLPFTSVLVMNIGARKGNKCPGSHWLYVPDSLNGFYRIGFYSNVNDSFLPQRSRRRGDRVVIYLEKAFRGGKKPGPDEMRDLCRKSVKELGSWGFIRETEVISMNWIDYAYTWRYPGSSYPKEAIDLLAHHGIFSIGRYGKWKFQGIAESIKEGLGVQNLQSKAMRG